MINFRAQLRLPPKAEPYTQSDCDVVIGHPVNLQMGALGQMTMLLGTITDAVIEDDGSAVITMEVTTA